MSFSNQMTIMDVVVQTPAAASIVKVSLQQGKLMYSLLFIAKWACFAVLLQSNNTT